MEMKFSKWMTCLKPSIYWKIVLSGIFKTDFVESVFQIYDPICYKEDTNKKCKVIRRFLNLLFKRELQ